MLSFANEFVVKVTVCPEFYECIASINKSLLSEDDVPINIRQTLEETDKSNCCLSVNDLKWLYSKLSVEKKRHIHKYLSMSEIILPKPEVLPRNPELQARIEKLKIIVAEKEYQTMTKNVDSSRVRHPEDTISSQMKEMNRQMIAVLQLLVSVSAGFTFGFCGIEYISGTLSANSRIFLGLFCAGVIMIAELYFLIKKIDGEYSSDSANNNSDKIDDPQQHRPIMAGSSSKNHHPHQE